MALDFHALSLADRERVLRYTLPSGKRNCDLSFANLYGWQFLYRTEVAEWEGFLFFRFYADGHLAYMLPLGEGDLLAAVNRIKDDACRLGHPFLLLGVGRNQLPLLRDFEQGDYVLNENRAYADYIYLRESLATLAGKKLQPKRNHANKFRRLYPNYEYRPLTPELVPECLALDEEWMTSKSVPSEQRAVRSEAQAIRRVLSHLEELQILGGTIFVEGRLVAFTYGAPVNGDTFDVCVEKADRKYEGAYAVINQEFARHLPERYVYVNREEDLGIEGLRQTKMAYQPHLLLEKFSLWSACSLQHQLEADIQSRRDLHVKWQTRALWKLCFGDSDEFIRLYFTCKYRPEYNSFREERGQVVAALQRLPYRMNFQGREVPVAYVSGACTSPEHRGRGVMAALLGEVHRRMKADGQLFSLLIPASESLFGYYRRFGYADCPLPPEPQPVLSEEEAGAGARAVQLFRARPAAADEQAWYVVLHRTLQRRPGAVLLSPADWVVVLDDLFLSGGVVCVLPDAGGGVEALLLATLRDEELLLLESCAPTPDAEVPLIRAARQAYGLSPAEAVRRQRNAAQVRVVDAAGALALYAAARPEEEKVVRVIGDDAVLENNGFYRLHDGRCEKLPSPPCCTESLRADAIFNIGELPRLLFGREWPRLSLMLN